MSFACLISKGCLSLIDDFPFEPYKQAVQTAYQDRTRIRVALFGVRPLIGKVKSISRDYFILENDYSTSVIRYSEIRFITVYEDE